MNYAVIALLIPPHLTLLTLTHSSPEDTTVSETTTEPTEPPERHYLL